MSITRERRLVFQRAHPENAEGNTENATRQQVIERVNRFNTLVSNCQNLAHILRSEHRSNSQQWERRISGIVNRVQEDINNNHATMLQEIYSELGAHVPDMQELRDWMSSEDRSNPSRRRYLTFPFLESIPPLRVASEVRTEQRADIEQQGENQWSFTIPENYQNRTIQFRFYSESSNQRWPWFTFENNTTALGSLLSNGFRVERNPRNRRQLTIRTTGDMRFRYTLDGNNVYGTPGGRAPVTIPSRAPEPELEPVPPPAPDPDPDPVPPPAPDPDPVQPPAPGIPEVMGPLTDAQIEAILHDPDLLSVYPLRAIVEFVPGTGREYGLRSEDGFPLLTWDELTIGDVTTRDEVIAQISDSLEYVSKVAYLLKSYHEAESLIADDSNEEDARSTIASMNAAIATYEPSVVDEFWGHVRLEDGDSHRVGDYEFHREGDELVILERVATPPTTVETGNEPLTDEQITNLIANQNFLNGINLVPENGVISAVVDPEGGNRIYKLIGWLDTLETTSLEQVPATARTRNEIIAHIRTQAEELRKVCLLKKSVSDLQTLLRDNKSDDARALVGTINDILIGLSTETRAEFFVEYGGQESIIVGPYQIYRTETVWDTARNPNTSPQLAESGQYLAFYGPGMTIEGEDRPFNDTDIERIFAEPDFANSVHLPSGTSFRAMGARKFEITATFSTETVVWDNIVVPAAIDSRAALVRYVKSRALEAKKMAQVRSLVNIIKTALQAREPNEGALRTFITTLNSEIDHLSLPGRIRFFADDALLHIEGSPYTLFRTEREWDTEANPNNPPEASDRGYYIAFERSAPAVPRSLSAEVMNNTLINGEFVNQSNVEVVPGEGGVYSVVYTDEDFSREWSFSIEGAPTSAEQIVEQVNNQLREMSMLGSLLHDYQRFQEFLASDRADVPARAAMGVGMMINPKLSAATESVRNQFYADIEFPASGTLEVAGFQIYRTAENWNGSNVFPEPDINGAYLVITQMVPISTPTPPDPEPEAPMGPPEEEVRAEASAIAALARTSVSVTLESFDDIPSPNVSRAVAVSAIVEANTHLELLARNGNAAAIERALRSVGFFGDLTEPVPLLLQESSPTTAYELYRTNVSWNDEGDPPPMNTNGSYLALREVSVNGAPSPSTDTPEAREAIDVSAAQTAVFNSVTQRANLFATHTVEQRRIDSNSSAITVTRTDVPATSLNRIQNFFVTAAMRDGQTWVQLGDLELQLPEASSTDYNTVVSRLAGYINQQTGMLGQEDVDNTVSAVANEATLNIQGDSNMQVVRHGNNFYVHLQESNTQQWTIPADLSFSLVDARTEASPNAAVYQQVSVTGDSIQSEGNTVTVRQGEYTTMRIVRVDENNVRIERPNQPPLTLERTARPDAPSTPTPEAPEAEARLPENIQKLIRNLMASTTYTESWSARNAILSAYEDASTEDQARIRRGIAALATSGSLSQDEQFSINPLFRSFSSSNIDIGVELREHLGDVNSPNELAITALSYYVGESRIYNNSLTDTHRYALRMMLSPLRTERDLGMTITTGRWIENFDVYQSLLSGEYLHEHLGVNLSGYLTLTTANSEPLIDENDDTQRIMGYRFTQEIRSAFRIDPRGRRLRQLLEFARDEALTNLRDEGVSIESDVVPMPPRRYRGEEGSRLSRAAQAEEAAVRYVTSLPRQVAEEMVRVLAEQQEARTQSFLINAGVSGRSFITPSFLTGVILNREAAAYGSPARALNFPLQTRLEFTENAGAQMTYSSNIDSQLDLFTSLMTNEEGEVRNTPENRHLALRGMMGMMRTAAINSDYTLFASELRAAALESDTRPERIAVVENGLNRIQEHACAVLADSEASDEARSDAVSLLLSITQTLGLQFGGVAGFASNDYSIPQIYRAPTRLSQETMNTIVGLATSGSAEERRNAERILVQIGENDNTFHEALNDIERESVRWLTDSAFDDYPRYRTRALNGLARVAQRLQEERAAGRTSRSINAETRQLVQNFSVITTPSSGNAAQYEQLRTAAQAALTEFNRP